jgi:hypothetical protein
VLVVPLPRGRRERFGAILTEDEDVATLKRLVRDEMAKIVSSRVPDLAYLEGRPCDLRRPSSLRLSRRSS